MGSALVEDKVSPVVGGGGPVGAGAGGGLKGKETGGEPMFLGLPLKYVSYVPVSCPSLTTKHLVRGDRS
jgi:hypothetical protein